MSLTPFELFLFSGVIICLRCLLPIAISFPAFLLFLGLRYVLVLLPKILASASHSWCGFFWVPHLILCSGMLDVLYCPTYLLLVWFYACLACFLFYTFMVGFRWPCWCSLTWYPGISLVPLPHPKSPSGCSSLFSTFGCHSGPFLPVVLLFHCSRCCIKQLVFLSCVLAEPILMDWGGPCSQRCFIPCIFQGLALVFFIVWGRPLLSDGLLL